MPLRITKNSSPSYTLREIFEDENPELWNKVQALSKRLADLQEMVIPVMPLLQQQLLEGNDREEPLDYRTVIFLITPESKPHNPHSQINCSTANAPVMQRH